MQPKFPTISLHSSAGERERERERERENPIHPAMCVVPLAEKERECRHKKM